jgi:alkylated DNA repair protein alkB family protein 7
MTDFLDEFSEIPGILERVRQQLELHLLTTNQQQEQEQPVVVQWLPCHAIDLKREGELTAHVDSIKFSGDLVAGLSLRSASIMRLMIPEDDYGDDDDNSDAPADGKVGHVDLYLPPLSLYVLTGVGRYRYSHQLLPDQSTFCLLDDGNDESIVVPRDQRLSVIFRDAKAE